MQKQLFTGLFLGLVLISGEAAARSRTTSSSTITYQGVTYTYSGSSTCADGSAALRYNRKWWCPVVTTTSTTGTTSSGTTSTSTTTTTGTSTTTTGTSTTTTTTTTTVPPTYSAKLSWNIPNTRADGTALTLSEVAGYEIYYTTDTGTVSATIPISGASTINTSVSNLASGNYYFSISAIDTTGLKSALSSVAAISFP